jgi:LuxR family maltose regulon positive regulatory protein
MATPLLTTKLYIPPVRPELVSRPRLIERLNAGLDRKLTLVSAPAGFGKTTLLSEWAAAGERPVAWLSLDEGDNDLVRFLAYFVAGLQTNEGGIGETALAMHQSSQPPPLESILTTLINEIAEIPHNFALVLDDYHVIEAQPIHEALAFLIDHLPPQAHLVISGRSDPPLPLSRLRGRGQLSELRTADLRFAPDEAAAFLNQVMGLKLSSEDVAALEERTEGWIVGLQMAALSMRGRGAKDASRFIAALSGSHRYILDYLADEVLLQQPESVQTFLLQTAILDRLTGPLCDAVTGRDDRSVEPVPSEVEGPTTSGQEMLEQLEAANLFIVPLDDERRWYRYHHLFTDLLRTELDKESQSALHLKAARWFAANDLLPEAVKHGLSSGDMNEAAQLIALAAEGAFRTASFTSLSGWLDALPDELVRANGELATYKGLISFWIDHHDEASAYAAAAEHSLSPEAPSPAHGRLLSLKAGLALCYYGTLDSAIQLSKEALDYLDEDDVFFRSVAWNIEAQALEMQDDIAAATEVYRDALLAVRQAGDQAGTMLLLANLAYRLNELGRRREAVEWCRRVMEEGAAQPGRILPSAGFVYVVWSFLSYEANEVDLAREQVSRWLDLREQGLPPSAIFLGRYILAKALLASGEIDAVLEVVRDVHQLAGRLRVDAAYEAWFAALGAQARLQQGDLAAAAHWAEEAKLAPADTPQLWSEFIYPTYVRLLLAQEQLENAQTLLETMERWAQESGRHRRLITVYLQQVLVQQAQGDKEQALDRIEKALHLAAPEGYLRSFLDEGPAIVDLLPQARHIAPDFVDEVLNAAGVRPVITRAQELVEPLSERELEVLRLLAAGLSNREIAEELYLSINTVKTHTKSIYGKLGVRSRTQAVNRARELELL